MLRELILSITSRCNLRCRMCDIPLTKTEELDTCVWERVIQEAASLGATLVVFSGGEPLLREDLCELIAFSKKQKMTVCVTSNGILIDEKRAYELLCAGVDVVNVSLEGPPEIHDQFRGKGSFDRALSAIKNLNKYGIECTVASVVTAKNYQYLPYVVELAKQEGVTHLKFQPFSRIFLSAGKNEDEFFLSEKDLPVFEKTIKEVVNLCRAYGIGTNPAKYFDEMPRYLVGKTAGGQHHCPALYLSCPINARGEVYPCWVLSGQDYMIGSVKENNFSSLWNSSKRIEIIKTIGKKGCQGCLMSCYDENFGKEGLDMKISKHLGRLRHTGPKKYISGYIKRWEKRLKFYASWRGNASSALRRVQAKLAKKIKATPTEELAKKEVRGALEELGRIKRLFEKESKNIR